MYVRNQNEGLGITVQSKKLLGIIKKVWDLENLHQNKDVVGL